MDYRDDGTLRFLDSAKSDHFSANSTNFTTSTDFNANLPLLVAGLLTKLSWNSLSNNVLHCSRPERSLQDELGCRSCGEIFSRLSHLRRHLRCRERFHCTHCDTNFSFYTKFRNHTCKKLEVLSASLVDEYELNLQPLMIDDSPQDGIICSDRATCTDDKSLQVTDDCDVKSVHQGGAGKMQENSSLRCQHCLKVFVYKKSLAKHRCSGENGRNGKVRGNTKEKSKETEAKTIHENSSKEETDAVQSSSDLGGEIKNEISLQTDSKVLRLRHHSSKWYVKNSTLVDCPHCEHKGPKSTLRSHIFKVHPEKLHACPECSSRFIKQTDFQAHMTKKHTHINTIECELCGKKFATLGLLNQHIKTAHKKPFMCHLCSKKCGMKCDLERHLLCHMENRPRFHCDQCDKSFALERGLKEHAQLHVNPDRFPWVCETCGLQFKLRRYFTEHTRQHHVPVEKRTCGICTKVFVSINALKMHMKRHNATHRHPCKTCGKLFHFARDLLQHELRHHSHDRPHVCRDCSKSFATLSFLNVHMKFHQPQIPCRTCGKKFAHRSTLTKHMYTHTSRRPHECELCQKKFKRLGDLMRHKRVVHSKIRPYKCDKCLRVFSDSSNRRSHKCTHSGGKNSCPVSQNTFKNTASLKQPLVTPVYQELVNPQPVILNQLDFPDSRPPNTSNSTQEIHARFSSLSSVEVLSQWSERQNNNEQLVTPGKSVAETMHEYQNVSEEQRVDLNPNPIHHELKGNSANQGITLSELFTSNPSTSNITSAVSMLSNTTSLTTPLRYLLGRPPKPGRLLGNPTYQSITSTETSYGNPTYQSITPTDTSYRNTSCPAITPTESSLGNTSCPAITPTESVLGNTSCPAITPTESVLGNTSCPAITPTESLLGNATCPDTTPTESVLGNTTCPDTTPTESVLGNTTCPTITPTESVLGNKTCPTITPTELLVGNSSGLEAVSLK